MPGTIPASNRPTSVIGALVLIIQDSGAETGEQSLPGFNDVYFVGDNGVWSLATRTRINSVAYILFLVSSGFL